MIYKGLFAISLFFLTGCAVMAPQEETSKTNTEDSPRAVFEVVNDAMLAGDLEIPLQYVCNDIEITEEEKSIIQMSLDLVPQEIRESITYSIDSVEEKDGYTEITATMALDDRVEIQRNKIYHKPSSAHQKYCIDLVEQPPQTEETTIEEPMQNEEMENSGVEMSEERIDIGEMESVNIESVETLSEEEGENLSN